MTAKRSRVQWFARGGGIARSGPYATQAEAAAAMRLAPHARERAHQEFPDDVFVWPEMQPQQRKDRR